MSEEEKKLQSIKEELRAILNLKSTIRDLGYEEVNTYKETLKMLEKEKGDLKQFQQLQKQINRDLIEAKAAISGIRDAFAASVDELVGMNAGLNRAKKSFRGLESIADKLSNDQADISRLSEKELKTIEEKVKKRHAELKIAKSSLLNEVNVLNNIKKQDRTPQQTKQLELKRAALNATQREIDDFENQVGLSQALINQAKDRIVAEKQIIKTMGAAPAILEGVGKALQKLGLPDFGVKEAVENTKNIIRLKNEDFALEHKIRLEKIAHHEAEYERLKAAGANNKVQKHHLEKAKELKKISEERVGSTQALGIVLGEIGKKLKDQITPANLLQSAIGLTVDAFFKMDTLSGTLAKNIGVSYDESVALQKNFNQIALNSDNIMVSTSALNESFASLNQRFQGATGFSNEMLESFTALTKQAGFSEEAIGNIAVVTGTQGKELESNLALMQGQLAVMNAQNGTSFSEKQLVQDIGKISKATLLTLRNQPKAVARTLMTSKKLVLSFQEMESIASSLLDFEGSIQNELSAELLTGKQLNLEQARLLALKGDVAGASAEVAKQVGNAAEFEKMNVIQQEALAKAAGLTREQLANSLMEREALAKLGGKDKTALEAYNRLKEKGLSDEAIANKLGNKRLAAQLKSQSVQENFAASVERLKEIFNDVALAVTPIATVIADMVVGISKFVAKFSFILKPLLLVVGAFKTIRLISGGINNITGGINKGLKSMANIKKNIVKFSKGEFAFQKQSLATHRRANILKKLGLISEEQSRMAKERATILDKRGVLTQKEKNIYANAGLSTQLKSNIQAKLSNVYERIKKQFTKEGLFYKGAILTKDLAINAAKVVNNGLSVLGLGFNKKNLFYRGAILAKNLAINAAEKVGNGLKAIGNQFTKQGLIYKGLIYAKDLAIIAAEKIGNGLKAVGNQFTKQGLVYKGLIYAKDLAIIAAEKIGNGLKLIGNQFTKEGLMYKGLIYAKNLAINIAEKVGNGLKLIGNQFTKEGLMYKGLIYAKDLAINIAQKVGNGLKAVGNQFTKQGLMYKGLIYAKDLAINTAQKVGNGLKLIGNQFTKEGLMYQGLIYTKQLAINIAERVSNSLKFIGLQFTKEGYVYQGLTYLKELAINTAKGIGNVLSSIGLGFNQENLIVQGAIFIKEQGLNALKAIGNALGLTSLSTTVAEGAAETVITANKQVQNRSMIGLIAKGLTYLGTLVAQAAAAITTASAMTLGIGTIAVLAAAAAGIAALYAMTKPKKAGDMIGDADGKTQISPAEGGLFELSDNDQFVAAPGIADAVASSDKAKNTPSTEGSNSQLITVLNSKLDQIIAINQRIAAVAGSQKQDKITLEMFGNEVGNGVQKDGRKLQ